MITCRVLLMRGCALPYGVMDLAAVVNDDRVGRGGASGELATGFEEGSGMPGNLPLAGVVQ